MGLEMNYIIKGRHYYYAEIKHYEWCPDCNEIKQSYITVEKDFTPKQRKEKHTDDVLNLFAHATLCAIIGCFGFMGGLLIGIGTTIGAFILSILIELLMTVIFKNHPYSYYLGEQNGWFEDLRLKDIFAEEIENELINKIEQEKLASIWRKKHPLEEKVRLALTKNPNYVADLLRYCDLVKPNKEIKKYIDQKHNNDSTNNNNINNRTQKIKAQYINKG